MDHPDKALRDLCSVSSWEMKQLQSQVQTLEDVVFTLLERGGRPNSKELQALQDFDLVIQTLAGLSGFYDRVQGQVDTDGPANLPQAAEGVTLEKLRMRILEPSKMQNA